MYISLLLFNENLLPSFPISCLFNTFLLFYFLVFHIWVSGVFYYITDINHFRACYSSYIFSSISCLRIYYSIGFYYMCVFMCYENNNNNMCSIYLKLFVFLSYFHTKVELLCCFCIVETKILTIDLHKQFSVISLIYALLI